jgi:hypothetical protein
MSADNKGYPQISGGFTFVGKKNIYDITVIKELSCPN